MRKLLLILILAHVSANVMAEWVRITGDENSTMYADLSSLRKTGSKAKMWSLRDNKAPLGKEKEKHLSAKIFFELDCLETNVRMIAASLFSKNMGAGQLISLKNSANSEWEPVEPESIGKAIWDVACKEDITEWTEIDATKEPIDGLRHVQYLALGTVVKTGDFAKIWHLTDFRSTDLATQSKNFSVKALREFDCKNRRTRYLETMFASGNMGIGTKTRDTEGLYKWEPIITGSLNELTLFLTCRTNE